MSGNLMRSLLAAACLGAVLAVDPKVAVKSAERRVDLSSQLVKIATRITFENRGAEAVSSLLIAVEPEFAPRQAFVGAKDDAKRELRVQEAPNAGSGEAKLHRVDLKDQLKAGETATIHLEQAFAKSLRPHPAKISQKERQLVKYEGNLYLYSPYSVESQKTVVALASKNVESFTKTRPFVHSDSTITYGPHENVAPFSRAPLAVHSENNSPFLTVTKIDRVIEVSHWGNIAVEETVDLYHSGAALDGPFSRYDYQQDSTSGPSSVKSYKTLLPASATGVYYRDTNGNISTSHMKIKKDAVELDLRPRFPLFGGWRTHYTLGYDVPSYEYLYNSADKYLLRMRLIDHVHDDMAVDEITTTIILPEGAADIKLIPPYPVKRHADGAHHTYLDTTGRPTVSFSKTNLVENHIQDFQLRYTFPRLLMLQEPILVVIFLYVLFLCVIIYVRLDFSINKDEHLKE